MSRASTHQAPDGVNPFQWIVAQAMAVRARVRVEQMAAEAKRLVQTAERGKELAEQEKQFAAERRARRA